MGDSKKRVTLRTCFFHDDKEGHLEMDAEMPGVVKNSLSLDVRDESSGLDM
jgi:hypothetical protein